MIIRRQISAAICVSDVIPGVGPKQLGSSPAAQSKANTAVLEQKNSELILLPEREREAGRKDSHWG